MKLLLSGTLLFFILLIAPSLHAQEIVGVNLVWGKKYISWTKSKFVFPIKVDLYVKDFPFPDNQSFNIVAYKKSSGKLTNLGLTINKIKRAKRVESGNLKCSDSFKIEVFHEEYEEKEFVFEAYDSFDPQDYYFVLDICCRPSEISNVKSNLKPAFAIAFEVPAFKDDNELNIIPFFKKQLNTFYYCKNKAFTIDFGAEDFLDVNGTNDELRYSLIRPQAGYNKGATDNSQLFKYYPSIKFLEWTSGFSDNRPLGKGNSLSVDSKTGMISGLCDRTGMYTIVVKVEQFRNGKPMGANLREYTFWVVDCPVETITKPIIKINNVEEEKYLMCYNLKVQLEVENIPGYVYEWKRNGNIIVNQTSNVLLTPDEGIYTVSLSDTKLCLTTGVSEPVELKAKNRRPVVQSSFNNVYGCVDKPAVLKLVSNEFNREVSWQKLGNNGYVVKAETLTVKENGVFIAKFSPSGCPNDSISVFTGVLIGSKYPTTEPTTKDLIVCPRTFHYYNVNQDFGVYGLFKWFKDEELVWDGPAGMPLTMPGKYTIFGGEAGCIGKVEELNVVWGDNCPKDQEENLYLPDVVTINGDNINETLEIFNKEAFPDLELFLYNRQGHLIFHKSGMFSIYEDNTLLEALKSMIGHQVAYRIKYNRGTLADKVGKIIIVR